MVLFPSVHPDQRTLVTTPDNSTTGSEPPFDAVPPELRPPVLESWRLLLEKAPETARRVAGDADLAGRYLSPQLAPILVVFENDGTGLFSPGVEHPLEASRPTMVTTAASPRTRSEPGVERPSDRAGG